MRECGFAEVLYRGLSLPFKAQCLPQIEGGLHLAGCHVVAQDTGLSAGITHFIMFFLYLCNAHLIIYMRPLEKLLEGGFSGRTNCFLSLHISLAFSS